MNEHLKEKPFYLGEEQIAFVEQKLSEMTLDEKIGQLLAIRFRWRPPGMCGMHANLGELQA